MIVKLQATDLAFELTTDTGDSVIDVAVSEYKVEFNTAQIPTVQNELLAVVKQLMSNISAAKAE